MGSVVSSNDVRTQVLSMSCRRLDALVRMSAIYWIVGAVRSRTWQIVVLVMARPALLLRSSTAVLTIY